jgi:hypothetical protein
MGQNKLTFTVISDDRPEAHAEVTLTPYALDDESLFDYMVGRATRLIHDQYHERKVEGESG